MSIAKDAAFWLVVGIGLCGLMIGFLWMLEKTVTWVTKSFEIYTDIVRFMYEKRKSKK